MKNFQKIEEQLQFKQFTTMYEMYCQIDINLVNGKKIIPEKWISKRNPLIRSTREYDFNRENILLIDKDVRNKFLKNQINIFLLDENYEDAHLLNSILNETK